MTTNRTDQLRRPLITTNEYDQVGSAAVSRVFVLGYNRRLFAGLAMAVQQNKKSSSKRGMHRAHDFLINPPTAIEPTTGEVHRRHHISATGFYRGKKVIQTKSDE